MTLTMTRPWRLGGRAAQQAKIAAAMQSSAKTELAIAERFFPALEEETKRKFVEAVKQHMPPEVTSYRPANVGFRRLEAEMSNAETPRFFFFKIALVARLLARVDAETA